MNPTRRSSRRSAARRRLRRVDGKVALPDAPGIGFERKADLWAVMKEV